MRFSFVNGGQDVPERPSILEVVDPEDEADKTNDEIDHQ